MSMGVALSSLVLGITVVSGVNAQVPIVLNTWPWPDATDDAWTALTDTTSLTPALDAVEAGCTRCEKDQCDGTVGFGGSPDENGETTLDAIIMNGTTLNTGAVGALRRIKNAIGVARHVLEHTEHSMLVGGLATNFAIENGFPEESLSTNESTNIWKHWKSNNCQPNYRVNTIPDATKSCGPYKPGPSPAVSEVSETRRRLVLKENHDTIGMVAIDGNGRIAAGTSTNGLRHKVPGRVGDSPIPGAGAYCDDDVGAAVATGDGDIMMRFLPTYQIVESMRQGMTANDAAVDAIKRIMRKYPTFSGAFVSVSKTGEIGAACAGFENFKFCYRTHESGQTRIEAVPCLGDV